MKLINIHPRCLNKELAFKICNNKNFKREYTRKYKEYFGGTKKLDFSELIVKFSEFKKIYQKIKVKDPYRFLKEINFTEFYEESKLLQGYIQDENFLKFDSDRKLYVVQPKKKIEKYKEHLIYCIQVYKFNKNMVTENYLYTYLNIAHGRLIEDSYFIVPKGMTLVFFGEVSKIVEARIDTSTSNLEDKMSIILDNKYCKTRFENCHIYFPGSICPENMLTFFDGIGGEGNKEYYCNNGLYSVQEFIKKRLLHSFKTIDYSINKINDIEIPTSSQKKKTNKKRLFN